MDELRLFVASYNTPIKIICINESWLHNEKADCTISIQSFNIIGCDCYNRIGGGVCVWLKDFINSISPEIEFIFLVLLKVKLFFVYFTFYLNLLLQLIFQFKNSLIQTSTTCFQKHYTRRFQQNVYL